MFQPKRSKLTTSITPENIRPEKPFVQAEGKLTEAQLEAIIAAWGVSGTGVSLGK